jgi:hypothetical protein
MTKNHYEQHNYCKNLVNTIHNAPLILYENTFFIHFVSYLKQ